MQWRDFPLPDGSYSDDCRPFTQQDVCNYLPTFAEATGTRSRVKFVPVPGLVTFAGVGDGPHRGIRDVEGKLFVVSGNTLYQVAADGTATSRGTIPGTRRVSMVHNQIDGGNELIIATGDNSYVWNTVTEVLTPTGVPLLFVDFLNQLIIGIDVARRFWRWSGLADGTSWNSLDVEAAESSPDRLVGQIVSQGEVLLFGERTIEVWSNSPSGNLTFQRSTVIEKGCANGNTICRLDNTVYFVGNDSIAYRLQGYTPVPIASKAITETISDGDPTKLFAFTWEDKGYVVYYLTAQDGNTWGFDVTCQKFHRRESFGLTRWRVNTLCKWNGDWYAGDYSNGKLYRLAWGNVYEGCDIMPRSLRTGVMHNNGNRMFVSALKLLVNTGRAPSIACAPFISGELPDTCDDADYSETLTITHGTAPFSNVQVVTGAKPAGLTFSTSGSVITATGSDMVAGDYDFWITVDDADGQTSIPFHVQFTVRDFQITGTLPDTSEMSTYSESLNLIGGVAPYVIALTSGALPTGGTITVTDGPSLEIDLLVFAWEFAAAGTYTFAGTVTDATGCVVAFSESVDSVASFAPSCVTDGFWLKADETTNSLSKDPDTDHYYGWTDSCHDYFFNTVTNQGDFAPVGTGPTTGSINGIRAVHFDSDDIDVQGFGVDPDAPSFAVQQLLAGTETAYVIAIWRNAIKAGTDPDRRVIYWSPEVPSNGNNIRFGLRAYSVSDTNGVSGQARQDYLDTAAGVNDNTDHAGEVVIAALVANWVTGTLDLYVNGSDTPITSAIPNFAGLSDAATPLKFFIGGQDFGSDPPDIHIGEIIGQAASAAPTLTQIQKDVGYLAWKWRGDSSDTDTVGLLPADHPYKSAPPTV